MTFDERATFAMDDCFTNYVEEERQRQSFLVRRVGAAQPAVSTADEPSPQVVLPLALIWAVQSASEQLDSAANLVETCSKIANDFVESTQSMRTRTSNTLTQQLLSRVSDANVVRDTAAATFNIASAALVAHQLGVANAIVLPEVVSHPPLELTTKWRLNACWAESAADVACGMHRKLASLGLPLPPPLHSGVRVAFELWLKIRQYVNVTPQPSEAAVVLFQDVLTNLRLELLKAGSNLAVSYDHELMTGFYDGASVLELMLKPLALDSVFVRAYGNVNFCSKAACRNACPVNFHRSHMRSTIAFSTGEFDEGCRLLNLAQGICCPLRCWNAFVNRYAQASPTVPERFCSVDRDESLAHPVVSDQASMRAAHCCSERIHRKTFFSPTCKDGPPLLALVIPEDGRAELSGDPVAVTLDGVPFRYQLFAALLKSPEHYCDTALSEQSRWVIFDGMKCGGRAKLAARNLPACHGFRPVVAVYFKLP
jgi:hypothetical protein